MNGDRHAWIDASAGIAGDMLLGALIDAGASCEAVQRALDCVLPGAIRIAGTTVTRAGMRAVKIDLQFREDQPPRRTWRAIRSMLGDSRLAEPTRARATAVFGRLAEAEGQVHGVAADEVHFHEVGALDAIADVVGICAALDDLAVTTVSAGEVALGSGRSLTEHGELPVPVPAVTHLARGWRVRAGGEGELATPTGMAALRTLASTCEDLPSMLVDTIGVGAGERDIPGRPNVVRVVVGRVASSLSAPPGDDVAVLLEANVDDLDPRLWPGVLARLLEVGAADAWLVPILMKKGRPAHTLSVLCHPSRIPAIRDEVFRGTSTLGLREQLSRKVALPRAFVDVEVAGGCVAIKLAHCNGVIAHVMPEFDDVAALAREQGRPERLVLQEASRAAAAAGMTVGAALPPHTRPA